MILDNGVEIVRTVLKENIEEMVNKMNRCGITDLSKYVFIYASDVCIDEDAKEYLKSKGIRFDSDSTMKESHFAFMSHKDYEQYSKSVDAYREVGCTRCPFAGHIYLRECPDAYTDKAPKCNLYSHEKLE